jgi:hypothetical protein
LRRFGVDVRRRCNNVPYPRGVVLPWYRLSTHSFSPCPRYLVEL